MTTARVAVVAGGSRGLGLLIARQLLRRGFRVGICARDEAELHRARLWLGPGVHTTACDVTDREAVGRWLAEVTELLGPVEVAITVAGVIQVGPAEDVTFEHFDTAIDIMLKGPLNVARLVEPGMRQRRLGRIGTVTSIGGMVSAPHLLPYCTAKFGAVGFSDGLAAALAGTGVTATTIVPGLMRTGSHDQALFVGDSAAARSWFSVAASLPLLSMDADRAAERIVRGVLRGSPMVVLTPLTWLAIRVRGVAPGLTTRLMQVANRLLPGATGNTRAVPGGEVAARHPSRLVDALTVLGRLAAVRNNER